MKRIIFAVFICAVSVVSVAAQCPISPSVEGPVSYYGKLKVRDGWRLIDGVKVKEGRQDTIKNVQVRGVSFGWSGDSRPGLWESSYFYNENAVERLVKDWKAEVLRAAYGATSSNLSSTNATANLERIKTVIEAAIKNDVYIIIDWHSHAAQNEVTQAKDFFVQMAKDYGKCDHVIFELYNEPLSVDWADIKLYAGQIIPEIRKHSDNLILVGTPTYSQKVQDVTPINDINIAYVLHFYAAEPAHNLSNWKSNIEKALSNDLPIFVTEYGTTTADGGQYDSTDVKNNHYSTHDSVSANKWHDYMDGKKISSVAWNVNDKYEGSAFFGTNPNRSKRDSITNELIWIFDQTVAENWSDTTKMTESGKYIFKKLNEYYLKVPWNPEATPVLHSTIGKSFGLEFFGGNSLTVNLLQQGHTILDVYSLQGKKLGNLLNDYQNAGNFNISFANLNLKSGIYIFNLRQNGNSQAKIFRIIK